MQKIENGKKALEKEKLARDEYEIALQNLDREKNEKIKQDNETDKKRPIPGIDIPIDSSVSLF